MLDKVCDLNIMTLQMGPSDGEAAVISSGLASLPAVPGLGSLPQAPHGPPAHFLLRAVPSSQGADGLHESGCFHRGAEF